MSKCWATVLLQTLVTLAVVSLCRASISRCPEGHYLSNGDKHTCKLCDTCPKNQIIRKPCTKHSNTLCGPFFEFNEFHQAPRPSLEVGDLPLPDEGGGAILGDGDGEESDVDRSKFQDILDSLDAKSDPKHKHSSHHKLGTEGGGKTGGESAHEDSGDIEVFPDVAGSSAAEDSAPKYQGGVAPSPRPRHQDNQAEPSMQDPDEGENQWKVLALALIVVLCIVCVFLIIFVFVVCYMRTSRAHLKKVLYSADNGPTARSLGRTYPSSQYVPVLTHAQGRAGTSGGAASAPPCAHASSYMYSDDYDADNSGQTISTTKSSDYVYFKSPHNGNNMYDV